MAAPRVSMMIGYTRNMGNFESLRLDVGIEIDVKEGESVDSAFNRVYEKLGDELASKIAASERALNG
jgi:hypothetical protein